MTACQFFPHRSHSFKGSMRQDMSVCMVTKMKVTEKFSLAVCLQIHFNFKESKQWDTSVCTATVSRPATTGISNQLISSLIYINTFLKVQTARYKCVHSDREPASRSVSAILTRRFRFPSAPSWPCCPWHLWCQGHLPLGQRQPPEGGWPTWSG